MLKSCAVCQRIHDSKVICKRKQYNITYKTTNKDKFRSTSVWQKKREEIKERDMYLCRNCLVNKKMTTKNLQVHHIVSLEEDFNKRLNNNNLITLCPICHELAESGEISKDSLYNLIKAGVNIPPYV